MDSTDMRLVVVGAAGRMGQTLIRIIAETPGARSPARSSGPRRRSRQGCRRDRRARPDRRSDSRRSAAAFAKADGVLDFTTPAATVDFAGSRRRRASSMSSARPGFRPTTTRRSRPPRAMRAIVKSGNMSLGVNLLAVLVDRRRGRSTRDFDIEILEMHHRHKVDAPSGTALLLGQAAAEGRGIDLAEHSVRERATAIPARASAATSASPRCAAARWSASTRSSSPARARASS